MTVGTLSTAGSARADWQEFDSADGLPNPPHDFYEDASGNMWFLTADYLNVFGPYRSPVVTRFDGLRWKSWELPQVFGVPRLGEDPEGNLWCAVRGASGTRLGRLDGDEWTFESRPDIGGPGSSVIGFAHDYRGRLLLAVDRSIRILEFGDSVRVSVVELPPLFDPITAIMSDSTGGVWISSCSSAGVARLTADGWTVFSPFSALTKGCAERLLCDRDGVVWVGQDVGGLARLANGEWLQAGTGLGLVDDHVYELAQDARGGIWCASDSGLSRFDGRVWTNYGRADGFPVNAPRAMMGDRSGNVWLSTGASAWRFDGEHLRAISPPPEVTVGAPCLEDTSGVIWFGHARGLARFDGRAWTVYELLRAPIDDAVSPILQAGDGTLWALSNGGGSRFDGTAWQPAAPESLRAAIGPVVGAAEAADGTIWWSSYGSGIWSFDGSEWQQYGISRGLRTLRPSAPLCHLDGRTWFGYRDAAGVTALAPSGSGTQTSGTGMGLVRGLIRRPDGALWALAGSSVGRYESTGWRTWTPGDPTGVNPYPLGEMVLDSVGTPFVSNDAVGAPPGVSAVYHFDGSTWVGDKHLDPGGLPCPCFHLSLDRTGGVWIGDCLARFEHGEWSTRPGLSGPARTSRMMEDSRGRMWFASGTAVGTYDRDRAAPQTVLFSVPPALSPLRNVAFSYVTGYGEGGMIEYSHRIDDDPWAPWDTTPFTGSSVPDGRHVFSVKARDSGHNEDPTPAAFVFEVDTQPPVPRIDDPVNGQIVQDTLIISGSARDARFDHLVVDLKPATQGDWTGPDTLGIVTSSDSVGAGELARLDTNVLSDGEYDLRLRVFDTLDLVGTALVRVIVDNAVPNARRTSPVDIDAEVGGDVYTTGGEVHLFLQPGSLSDDVTARIELLRPDSIAAALPPSLRLAGPVAQIGWDPRVTTKITPIDCATSIGDAQDGDRPRIRVLTAEGSWRLLGGFVDRGAGRITASLPAGISGATVAILSGALEDDSPPVGGLSFAPRVFSRSGPEARDALGISFTLPQGETASVRIYTRGGRVVRSLAEHTSFQAGTNLVYWDGKAQDGTPVLDGLYFVSIESASTRLTGSVAVVR